MCAGEYVAAGHAVPSSPLLHTQLPFTFPSLGLPAACFGTHACSQLPPRHWPDTVGAMLPRNAIGCAGARAVGLVRK